MGKRWLKNNIEHVIGRSLSRQMLAEILMNATRLMKMKAQHLTELMHEGSIRHRHLIHMHL